MRFFSSEFSLRCTMLALLACTQITPFELNLATTARDEPFIKLHGTTQDVAWLLFHSNTLLKVWICLVCF